MREFRCVQERLGASGPRHAPALTRRGWHARGYLPHFDSPEAVQTITFRLADSLPKAVYDELAADLGDVERLKRMDGMLDECLGRAVLREERVAEIVQDALQHFDSERYRLLAWVVMPNHVHAMIEQIEGYQLSEVVRSWKSYTAKAINRLQNSSGPVWASDFVDRFVRNERHYANALHYIEENPVKAGLVARAEDWVYSSANRSRLGALGS
jgi:putative transposase